MVQVLVLTYIARSNLIQTPLGIETRCVLEPFAD